MDEWADRNPLRVWRKAHGVTQSQAAMRIGVSMVTASLWERGSFQPGEDRWHKIGALMGESFVTIRERWTAWMAEGRKVGV